MSEPPPLTCFTSKRPHDAPLIPLTTICPSLHLVLIFTRTHTTLRSASSRCRATKMSEEELGYYGYADFLASAIISVVVFCMCCVWVCPLFDLGPHRPPFATTFLLMKHRQEDGALRLA